VCSSQFSIPAVLFRYNDVTYNFAVQLHSICDNGQFTLEVCSLFFSKRAVYRGKRFSLLCTVVVFIVIVKMCAV